MNLLQKKSISPFKKWLTQNGASVLAPTNPYELVRFECKLGTGVLYENAGLRQSVSGNLVIDAIAAFTDNKTWAGKGEKTRRSKSRASRKSKRDKLIERDGGSCFFCGNTPSIATTLTIEHFVSLTGGGPDELHNMVLACTRCNDEVGTMNVVEKVRYRDDARSIDASDEEG